MVENKNKFSNINRKCSRTKQMSQKPKELREAKLEINF